MGEILGIALADIEKSIEAPQQKPMRDLFDRALEQRLRHAPLRIAANEYRGAGTATGARGLEERFQVPAVDDERVELFPPNDFRDLGSVAPGEFVHRRRGGNVSQKNVAIAGKQIDIPIESDAKSRLPLLGCRLAMGEKDRHIGDRGQTTKPWGLVLDRMAREDSEAHEFCSDTAKHAQGIDSFEKFETRIARDRLLKIKIRSQFAHPRIMRGDLGIVEQNHSIASNPAGPIRPVLGNGGQGMICIDENEVEGIFRKLSRGLMTKRPDKGYFAANACAADLTLRNEFAPANPQSSRKERVDREKSSIRRDLFRDQGGGCSFENAKLKGATPAGSESSDRLAFRLRGLRGGVNPVPPDNVPYGSMRVRLSP